MYCILDSIIRAVATPLLQLILGIIVKRSLGLNREGPASSTTQWALIKRYINSSLLAQHTLKNAFDIIGTHYEMTSVCFSTLFFIPNCLPFTSRLSSVLWAQRSVVAFTGQALASTALIPNFSRLGTMLSSDHDLSSSQRIALARAKSSSKLEASNPCS
jgi:hypothetical protein